MVVKRNLWLWIGVGLAALAGLVLALETTALPVVVDVALAILVVAISAAVVLVVGTIREARRRPRAVRWRLALAAVALVWVAVCVAYAVHQRFLTYRSWEVSFESGDVDLSGSLYAPPRSNGRHPAVVFVHGSGPETRREYAFFAKLFARRGFLALAYDKRGTGRSTGRLYESDYRDYADDVSAAVQFLRRRDDVDLGCIGLVGFSEGEWVAPLAAAGSQEVGFLAVVAPSGVSPAQQVNEEIALRLETRGYGAEDIAQALSLNERVFEFHRTGRETDGLAQALREASGEPWFRDAEDIPSELYDPDAYRWWRSVMDFDPGPAWERVTVPVLLLKGGEDQNSTAELAQREIEAALERGGNERVEFVVFPEADHSMLRWPFGAGVPPPVFARGYLETLVDWASARCGLR